MLYTILLRNNGVEVIMKIVFKYEDGSESKSFDLLSKFRGIKKNGNRPVEYHISSVENDRYVITKDTVERYVEALCYARAVLNPMVGVHYITSEALELIKLRYPKFCDKLVVVKELC